MWDIEKPRNPEEQWELFDGSRKYSPEELERAVNKMGDQKKWPVFRWKVDSTTVPRSKEELPDLDAAYDWGLWHKKNHSTNFGADNHGRRVEDDDKDKGKKQPPVYAENDKDGPTYIQNANRLLKKLWDSLFG